MKLCISLAATAKRMNAEEWSVVQSLNKIAKRTNTPQVSFHVVNHKGVFMAPDERNDDEKHYTNTYIEFIDVRCEGRRFTGTVMMHADGKGLTAVGTFDGKKRGVYAVWDAPAMTRRQLLEYMPKFFYSKVFLANP